MIYKYFKLTILFGAHIDQILTFMVAIFYINHYIADARMNKK